VCSSVCSPCRTSFIRIVFRFLFQSVRHLLARRYAAS
jgi:hypothetical protein